MKLSAYEVEEYLRSKGLQLRPRGSNKVEVKQCPFCGGGNNKDYWKFVVYTDGGNFKCMRGSCDATGTFWALAEHFGDDPKGYYDAPVRTDVAIRPRKHEYTPPVTKPDKITPEAREYLHKRGFSDKTIEYCKLYCEDGNIAFPYYKGDEVAMVKYRAPRKPAKGERKAWQSGGGLRTLWGIEECDLNNPPAMVIVFGEYDRMACVEADIANCVSVPHGDQDLAWIDICWDQLQSCREIYLWPDNDESGWTAYKKIVKRLGPARVRVIKTDRKDANELLFYDGKDAVWEAMASAEYAESGDIKSFCEIEEELLDLDGFKTGIPLLDDRLGGLLNGRLTLVTGPSSVGKSTLVNQLTVNGIHDGAVACVWPGEDTMSDYRFKVGVTVAGRAGTELRTSRAGVDYPAVKPEYWPKIDEFLNDRLFVLDRRVGMTEDVLLSNFQLAYERYGASLFVVDNLMKLVVSRDGDTLPRQMRVVEALVSFAKKTKTHILLVTHNKKKFEDRPSESLWDISGAAEIGNLADSCVECWRVPDSKKHEFENRDAVISLLKNRVFGRLGKKGVTYDTRTKMFTESFGVDEDKYLVAV